MTGSAAQRGRRSGGWLVAYYLATPLFAVADLAWGLPVRAAGIEAAHVRVMYYVLLVFLGVFCRARPSAAPWVGMGESAVTLTLLILAVLVPVWDAAGGAEVPAPGLVLERTTNLALSGSVLAASFYRHQALALRPRRGGAS